MIRIDAKRVFAKMIDGELAQRVSIVEIEEKLLILFIIEVEIGFELKDFSQHHGHAVRREFQRATVSGEIDTAIPFASVFIPLALRIPGPISTGCPKVVGYLRFCAIDRKPLLEAGILWHTCPQKVRVIKTQPTVILIGCVFMK